MPALRSACARALRFASTTSANPLPFPTHPHPTPHQIFHLPHAASQHDIKARYYDLVKIHHPDSPHNRAVPPAERHARFQSITHAYDVLRRKSPLTTTGDWTHDLVRAELERRRRHGPPPSAHPRARGARHFAGADFPSEASVAAEGWNDRWKDKILVCIAVLALGAAVFPSLMYAGPAQIDRRHRSAAANLAQARAEAREFGQERRAEIRRRVQQSRDRENDVDTNAKGRDIRADNSRGTKT